MIKIIKTNIYTLNSLLSISNRIAISKLSTYQHLTNIYNTNKCQYTFTSQIKNKNKNNEYIPKNMNNSIKVNPSMRL
jgi:hypothetical protein